MKLLQLDTCCCSSIIETLLETFCSYINQNSEAFQNNSRMLSGVLRGLCLSARNLHRNILESKLKLLPVTSLRMCKGLFRKNLMIKKYELN